MYQQFTDGPLPIKIRIKQGFSLAPYIFFMVGQALNSISKLRMQEGSLAGIILTKNSYQQLKDDLRSISALLQKFYLASKLQTNWSKSYGY